LELAKRARTEIPAGLRKFLLKLMNAKSTTVTVEGGESFDYLNIDEPWLGLSHRMPLMIRRCYGELSLRPGFHETRARAAKRRRRNGNPWHGENVVGRVRIVEAQGHESSALHLQG